MSSILIRIVTRANTPKVVSHPLVTGEGRGHMAGAPDGLASSLRVCVLIPTVRAYQRRGGFAQSPLPPYVKEAHRNLIGSREDLVSRLAWLLC